MNDDELIRRRYKHTQESSGYQSLVSSRTVVLGVWDDHDFGLNDGGSENPAKDTLREIYLDFIEEPADS